MFSTKKLRHLFASSPLSVVEIASRLDIDYPTLTRLLSGSTTNPSPKTVHSLARYFGIVPAELYDNTVENKPNYGINGERAKLTNIKEILSQLLLTSGLLNTNALHKASGIPKANLDRIISGVTQTPGISTIRRLADFFNLSIAQIMGLEPIENNHATPTNQLACFKIPLLTLTGIKAYVTGLRQNFQIPYAVIDSETEASSLLAFQIADDKFEPDFSRGSILVINSEAPLKASQFIIAELGVEILVCEFHHANNDFVFIREAGTANMLRADKTEFCVLGVVIQEVCFG